MLIDLHSDATAQPQPRAAAAPVRHALLVHGVVQGVGFRPFVYRLATELHLTGFVRNDAQGVAIEVQGAPDLLEQFAQRLRSEAPALARIEAVQCVQQPPTQAAGFVIRPSDTGNAGIALSADVATCPACLDELFDRSGRRWRYPFINCTQCGPRYTITRALPYDRPNTSMARFTQCSACQAEYDDPSSRRFHAQPNACPICGPRIDMVERDGRAASCADPLAETLRRLMRGAIVALKGLGGFHLACDARNAAAVARLRRRKAREEKAFALMAANVASAAAIAHLDRAAEALLQSRERPIVLLPKIPACDALLPGVAPGLAHIGVMLPYTPLHALLFHEAAGRPEGTAWLREPQPMLLVMTSANPAGEPLITDNGDALARLAPIADALLLHDRDILVRCDDSVLRVDVHDAARDTPPSVNASNAAPRSSRCNEWHDELARVCAATVGNKPQSTDAEYSTGHAVFIRRARGYTPRAIKLAVAGPPVLAVGAWLKNTVCITRGDEAFLSQYIGDLDNAAACVAMEQAAAHLLDLLQVEPQAVAHDLHPDFHSSRFALQIAHERRIPAIGVQHHHAHIAALLAEHRISEPVIGLALDGVGLGTDGSAWGGELLLVDYAGMRRLGHLRPLALPGGDRAAREPWRMAAAALFALGRGDQVAARYAARGGDMLTRMLMGEVNCPTTTSAGRWFDAAAGLLGASALASYEGQAAMLLESLAHRHGAVEPLPDGYAIDDSGVLDPLPLFHRLADPIDPAYGAALFHATLAAGLAHWAIDAARRHAVRSVALGGGCFLNAILSCALRAKLLAAGLRVLEAHAAPPNDGGIALGQAWVALHTLTRTA